MVGDIVARVRNETVLILAPRPNRSDAESAFAIGCGRTRTGTNHEQVPAGCANTRRADRTQVWTDPLITRVARDASGRRHSSGRCHDAPLVGGARHESSPEKASALAREVPTLVIGAVIGTIPTLHASDHRPLALPVERRITLEPRRLEAALAHVKIWTPSETLPLLFWQDSPGPADPGLEPGAANRSHAASTIPPGPARRRARRRSRQLTGVTVTLSEDGIRTLPSPGVTGMRSVEQALTALLDRHRRRLSLHRRRRR